MSKQNLPEGMAQVMPRIRCVPVDTNVLLKNMTRDVRQWPNPTGLRFLGESGTLSTYAAPHVGAEVDEKLDAWMRDRGAIPRSPAASGGSTIYPASSGS